MTQEEKDLLLQDLCSRLPYQPICEFTDTEDDFCTATAALGYSLRDFIAGKVLIKPYLRPMSSMTDEEDNKRKQSGILCSINSNHEIIFDGLGNESADIQLKALDWLNKHHFDYRGLIEKGVALEAPEGMYNIKEK